VASRRSTFPAVAGDSSLVIESHGATSAAPALISVTPRVRQQDRPCLSLTPAAAREVAADLVARADELDAPRALLGTTPD
jgi:hypothetical protein